MSGEEIRELIKGEGFKLWQVAYKLGVSDFTFSRWLRKPFDEKQVSRVENALKELKAEREV